MKRRHKLTVMLQIALVLVASLLAAAINYATKNAPLLLTTLRRFAIPGVVVLIVALIFGNAMAFRLENPPLPRLVWDRRRIPYPGLDAFTEEDAAVFFGREVQSADLTRRLNGLTRRHMDRFIALAGASGSGKSSLVRAGVVPRLRRTRWLVLPVLTPGSNPMAALAQVLAGANTGTDAHAVLRRLRRGPHVLGAVLA
jgi:hypothetical protein